MGPLHGFTATAPRHRQATVNRRRMSGAPSGPGTTWSVRVTWSDSGTWSFRSRRSALTLSRVRALMVPRRGPASMAARISGS